MYSVKKVLTDIPVLNLPEGICVMDIETAGFSAKYSPVLLLGLAYIERGSWVAEIHLCEKRSEEPLLLSQWAHALHRFFVFFTYYGKGFDVPFLKERGIRHNTPLLLPSERHVDLFQKGRLKQVEKEAGFHRQDTLSGKDWTHLYRTFEREQSPSQKDLLVLHNLDDLKGTIHLLLSREDLRDSLPCRFIEDKFLAETFPSPGNLRIVAVDRDNVLWCRDLPLLSFGKYHFLDIGESFDLLSPKEKEQILLLEGRSPQYHNIHSLHKSDDFAPFLVDNQWRRC
ncbi:MAG TPA: ribonuclease H-like domain-containing protein [Tissierellia bacterium]|jgi:hypothetical protein|nr:ribonuclease H-like domain-containing protein [Tissierellia bacterium]